MPETITTTDRPASEPLDGPALMWGKTALRIGQLPPGHNMSQQRTLTDCFQAAAATALNVPYGDVPEARDMRKWAEWAAAHGLAIGTCDPEVNAIPPGIWVAELELTDQDGEAVDTHALTCTGDEVVWDPDPEQLAVRFVGWPLRITRAIAFFATGSLDASPIRATGSHRWQGQIQAKGDVGTENFSVDRVWLVPTDEPSGVLRAPLSLALGAATYAARSEFNSESGAINGDSLAAGGTWASSGDTNDISVAAGIATRSDVSDAGAGSGSLNAGRSAIAGSTTYSTIAVSIDFKTTDLRGVLRQGLYAKWTDASNYIAFYYDHYTGGIHLEKRASGTSADTTLSSGMILGGGWYTLTAAVAVDGSWAAQLSLQGGAPILKFIGRDNALTGSGKPGFVDQQTDTNAATRSYDNFSASVPTLDAVAFALQSVELNTLGITREDSTGTAYGPVSVITGDLPRMPNRASGGTVEFFGKMSRGDLQTINDPNIDDLSVRVYRRPSYLLVP